MARLLFIFLFRIILGNFKVMNGKAVDHITKVQELVQIKNSPCAGA